MFKKKKTVGKEDLRKYYRFSVPASLHLLKNLTLVLSPPQQFFQLLKTRNSHNMICVSVAQSLVTVIDRLIGSECIFNVHIEFSTFIAGHFMKMESQLASVLIARKITFE